MSYIDCNDLVFYGGSDNQIYSGGFSVNSIMMKAGMSPIMTLNNNDSMIGGNKVSDLFNDLVVPNWALTYNNRIIGGKYKEIEHNDDSESDDDEVISDDLHDKLLDLVKQHNVKSKENKKKITRKNKKILSKKGGTKKKK